MESTVDIEALAKTLTKPIRPLWLTHDSVCDSSQVPRVAESPFFPLYCLSCSQPVDVEKRAGTILLNPPFGLHFGLP